MNISDILKPDEFQLYLELSKGLSPIQSQRFDILLGMAFINGQNKELDRWVDLTTKVFETEKELT